MKVILTNIVERRIMNNDEKITKILRIIDDLLYESDKLTVKLEMLDGYIQVYGDEYSDFWKLTDYCGSLLNNHKSVKNKIEFIHDVLVED